MTTRTLDGQAHGRRFNDRLALGLALIALGGVLFLEQIGLMTLGGMHRLWPLFPVAFGLARLFSPGQRSEGLLMLGVGLIFLVQTFGVARLHQTWPLFLVLGGLSMLTHDRERSCSRSEAVDHKDDPGWRP